MKILANATGLDGRSLNAWFRQHYALCSEKIEANITVVYEKIEPRIGQVQTDLTTIAENVENKECVPIWRKTFELVASQEYSLAIDFESFCSQYLIGTTWLTTNEVSETVCSTTSQSQDVVVNNKDKTSYSNNGLPPSSDHDAFKNWYHTLKRQAESLNALENLRTSSITDDIQVYISEYNTAKLKREMKRGHRPEFKNLNYECRGPRGCWPKPETCPRNSQLTWSTAKIQIPKKSNVIKFDIRCVECAAEYSLSHIYKINGILADDEDKETKCSRYACESSRMYRAVYCPVHLLSISATNPRFLAGQCMKMVPQVLDGKWILDGSSGFEPFLNRKAQETGARFFAVDLEGLLSRHPPVLNQVCAVELGTAALDSNEFRALFNLNIDNPPEIDETPRMLMTIQQNLSSFGTHDYWLSNQDQLSGRLVSPTEAAEIISDSGITTNDYLIVWHKGIADVSGLRYLLSQAGIRDTLPSDDHIIRLPYLFKHNLKLPSGVSCSLELLFNAYFPQHHLRAVHHDAFIDSQKTLLMALLAEQFMTQ